MTIFLTINSAVFFIFAFARFLDLLAEVNKINFLNLGGLVLTIIMFVSTIFMIFM